MSEAIEHLLVRQRPAVVGAESAYVASMAGGIVRLNGNQWYRLPAAVAEQLRDVGLHGDMPGHRKGEKGWTARFDVIDQATFRDLVAAERARVEAEADKAARQAAERAIAARMAEAPLVDGITDLAVQDAVIEPLDLAPAKEGEKAEPLDLAQPVGDCATIPECQP